MPGVDAARRALPGRRGGRVPARRADAAGRLPRRPHALRGAAARRGPAAARAGRGRGRRRAGGRARAAAGLDARRAAARRRRGALPRRGDRARARERRADRVGARRTGCSRPSPDLSPRSSIRLAPGADRGAVDAPAARARRAARSRSAARRRATRAFLGVLAAVLRGVGLAVGLVCLYALVQALAMTARERRGAVALLRASGADARDGRARAGGRGARRRGARPRSAGVVLEALVLGPLVARLAAGFAALPLGADARAGRCSSPAACSRWPPPRPRSSRRRVLREPVVAGLREE